MIFFTIRAIIKKFFFKFKIFIGQTVNDENLKKFLHMMKPITHNLEMIRLGEEKDGGYFVPKNLENISFCMTAGVGDLIKFEYDLAEKGIKCFMADNSVDKPPLEHKNFFFLKKFIGNTLTKDFISFDEWKNSIPIDLENEKGILKIDIEGDEYDLLNSLDKKLIGKFSIIIIEFHHLNSILNPMAFEYINNIFNKILYSHNIVHLENNKVTKPVEYFKNEKLYDMVEITFLNKKGI
jgi:hypothetical protein|tara:strand:+ start:418 stop:1128 length:711 start_codon:yes stop_codon:yes gene_type:complete